MVQIRFNILKAEVFDFFVNIWFINVTIYKYVYIKKSKNISIKKWWQAVKKGRIILLIYNNKKRQKQYVFCLI